MLTVKYVAPDGTESIKECLAVIADRTEHDGRPRVLTFDETPQWDKSNSNGVYVANDDECAQCIPLTALSGPIVYVMNRFGATVAKYPLRPHRVAEMGMTGGGAG